MLGLRISVRTMFGGGVGTVADTVGKYVGRTPTRGVGTEECDGNGSDGRVLAVKKGV
jgi:hypothetical protein